MSCPKTHHLNNVPRLRGEKHEISLKILHQAGFETARQAATTAEPHALAIASCPSLISIRDGVCICNKSERYCGAVPCIARKVNTFILKIILFSIGSQCRFRSTGVIESNLRVRMISLAAEYWIFGR